METAEGLKNIGDENVAYQIGGEMGECSLKIWR
jgi:hypothetical protein